MTDVDPTLWASTIAAVSGLATALFTGLHFRLAKRQDEGMVVLDWQNDTNSLRSTSRRCHVRNLTKRTISIRHVTVKGPVEKFTARAPQHSDHGWKKRFAPLFIEVPAGGSQVIHVSISPDLDKARRAFKFGLYRPRWVSWLSWHLFSAQSPYGIKFSIRIIIHLSSDSSKTSVFTHCIRLNEATIMQIAAKAEAKDAST